jgi:hypothetical protein
VGDRKRFPEDFIEPNAREGRIVKLPKDVLRLEQDNQGNYILKIEAGAYLEVRNPAVFTLHGYLI